MFKKICLVMTMALGSFNFNSFCFLNTAHASKTNMGILMDQKGQKNENGPSARAGKMKKQLAKNAEFNEKQRAKFFADKAAAEKAAAAASATPRR